uniref:Tetratricopeptide SHNi-TPR domain-containing protein n=1 Tax=Clastoptera arizonana TaxID=38151 RepID=A0A1B6DE97_9HEMI
MPGKEEKEVEECKVNMAEKTTESNSKEEEKKNGSEESPIKNEALSLLAQGRRHLFVKDYPSAVTVLGEACAKLAEIYGELGDECGDAYFNYGRALLEQSREESNLLNEKDVDGDKDDTDDEENEVENGEEKIDEREEKDNEEEKTEKEDEKTLNENEEDKPIDEGKTNNEGKTNDEGEMNDEKTNDEEKSNDEEKTNDDEEDVNNLQLAWEIFELAKVIYSRQNNEAKLAETYLYLGEVSLESENYTSAVEDMKQCLEIQKKILPEDHRDIAETLFQLGVACSFQNLFEESKAFHTSACEVLQLRIKNLKSGCYSEESNSNPFYSVEKEIEEINNILPEIKEKIDDVEDLKREAMKSVLEMTLKGVSSLDGAGSSSQNGNTEKPAATNISHLIKKKRKPEDDLSPKSAKKKQVE